MDELKNTLQIDEQNSNDDLDFFDAMEDQNAYLPDYIGDLIESTESERFDMYD